MADIKIDRTVTNTAAAAYTGYFAIILEEIVEFVLQPLTPAGLLPIPGIMTGTMLGEQGGHTAVPGADTAAFIAADFFFDVEAVASGAIE